MKSRVIVLFSAICLFCSNAYSQTITVKDTVYVTYGFSDPNPVPVMGNIYPYHKFETFSFTPENRTWKMVVLENEWLRVRIMPEIGGKIWSVYDKTTGKELFYDNDVVKFREISLRGPWTSGGIEFNYGIIGHAPSCAHPVEWSTEKKADGSVSCYIGVLELLTRTNWTIEINLPKDAAWVRTRSFWHNRSGEYQPYYTWANSGVTASDDLEIIYPGSYTIDHEGRTFPFPIDEQGRDLSKYSQQAFGVDKSFHPGGSHKGFFGAYWSNGDFGMLHYALRDEKLGRKYFSWTQSGQGEIWRDILTDKSPQYVELQSGRLFNQNLLNSVQTPFKQTLFSPYGTDEWNEYWLPFSGIGSADNMTLDAVVSIDESDGLQKIGIFPLKSKSVAKISVYDDSGKVICEDVVDLKTAHPIVLEVQGKPSEVLLDGKRIWSLDNESIQRPHVIDSEFSLTSPEGLVEHARYLYGMRYYKAAEEKVDLALSENPSLIGALVMKAQICLRKGDYRDAFDYAGKVLSIDAYEPSANYIRGCAASSLGLIYDAMDSFEIAAITSELRSAACMQLARIHFTREEMDLAMDYAKKSLVGNAHNVSALELMYQISPSKELMGRIQQLDPLSAFPMIERLLNGEVTEIQLAESIKEELRWQVYMEYAAAYSEIGLNDKAEKLLAACPEKNALVQVWSAWLKDDTKALEWIDSKSLDLVFPFRRESEAPLKWAVDNSKSWECRYMLSMLENFLGHGEYAVSLIDSISSSSYAPFYAYRASLTGSEDDMKKAVSLDPEQWRYRQNLALKMYRDGRYDEGIKMVEKYYHRHKDNFHIGDTYLKLLIAKGMYVKANNTINTMRILPFEGQTGSHIMWRDIKLHLAAQAIDKGNYKDAFRKIDESLQWPTSLGVGKPYEELIDTDTEYLLMAIAARRSGDEKKALEYLSFLHDSSDAQMEFYRKCTTKTNGKYPSVLDSLGNMDASLDKKLF